MDIISIGCVPEFKKIQYNVSRSSQEVKLGVESEISLLHSGASLSDLESCRRFFFFIFLLTLKLVRQYGTAPVL